MALLKIVTQNNARVECYSDGVLMEKHEYLGWCLMAMSLIGPEEAVRSIAAGCRVTPGEGVERTVLGIMNPDGSGFITAKWMGDWQSSARVLSKGALHLAAHATSVCDDKGKQRKPVQRIIYPGAIDQVSLYAALYQTCLLHYTTPLIPPGRPGQPKSEAEIGRQWQLAVGRALSMDADLVTMLQPHPGAKELGLTDHWPNACVLSAQEEQLDELVRSMVRRGRITIPLPTKEAPCIPTSESAKNAPAVAAIAS